MSLASDARFWDRTSRKYARSAISDQAGYERTVERTRTLLRSGDRVLELGCGTGTTALRLAGDVRDYLATDVSTGMIAIANEKHAVAPIPSLAFRAATAEAIAPEAAPFDAALGAIWGASAWLVPLAATRRRSSDSMKRFLRNAAIAS